jgi:hypothetical protein
MDVLSSEARRPGDASVDNVTVPANPLRALIVIFEEPEVTLLSWRLAEAAAMP